MGLAGVHFWVNCFGNSSLSAPYIRSTRYLRLPHSHPSFMCPRTSTGRFGFTRFRSTIGEFPRYRPVIHPAAIDLVHPGDIRVGIPKTIVGSPSFAPLSLPFFLRFCLPHPFRMLLRPFFFPLSQHSDEITLYCCRGLQLDQLSDLPTVFSYFYFKLTKLHRRCMGSE
ncbi:hypothetical protein VTO42DRAFT_4325 [Malbranchea cinnamomea]